MMGGAGAIGRISLDGTIDEFQVPTEDSLSELSTLAPDGAVWFLEGTASQMAASLRMARLPTRCQRDGVVHRGSPSVRMTHCGH